MGDQQSEDDAMAEASGVALGIRLLTRDTDPRIVGAALSVCVAETALDVGMSIDSALHAIRCEFNERDELRKQRRAELQRKLDEAQQ